MGGGQNNSVQPMRFTAGLNQNSDDYVNPEAFSSDQRATWEKAFGSDRNWRLVHGTGNTWTYAPSEPTSEQYSQGKQAMEDVTSKVMQMIKPGSGSYDPRYVPMRGGGHGGIGDYFEQLHFDPSRSQDKNLAQLMDVIQRIGMT